MVNGTEIMATCLAECTVTRTAYCVADRSHAAVSADCCWQDSVSSTLLDDQSWPARTSDDCPTDPSHTEHINNSLALLTNSLIHVTRYTPCKSSKIMVKYSTARCKIHCRLFYSKQQGSSRTSYRQTALDWQAVSVWYTMILPPTVVMVSTSCVYCYRWNTSG